MTKTVPIKKLYLGVLIFFWGLYFFLGVPLTFPPHIPTHVRVAVATGSLRSVLANTRTGFAAFRLAHATSPQSLRKCVITVRHLCTVALGSHVTKNTIRLLLDSFRFLPLIGTTGRQPLLLSFANAPSHSAARPLSPQAFIFLSLAQRAFIAEGFYLFPKNHPPT